MTNKNSSSSCWPKSDRWKITIIHFFTDKVEMRCADQKLRSSVLLLQNQATSWDVAGSESELR